ncbi:TRAP transporter small permease [Chelatococcus sp. SYSU_G07232]|uniref:TRAP transporter small permease protein n=1 Tax=Chelatococcus albus TaxID=3047466 RepID=A0ABT7AMB8_9HYPH|nr:TRAP transporter small permease [Chelatococcus sp. SYSU_G07232]MDJ1160102.1 TRAP transporter small permease [Chelatococcus sp. SYSU_G07232]
MSRRPLDVLRTLERHVIGLLLILMSAGYVVNVLVRLIVPSWSLHLVWMEELALFALAWLVFLGLGITLEKGRQIAMTALFDRLPEGPRRALGLVINLTGVAFSAYITKLGYDFARFVGGMGQTSPTLDVSMIWLYAALPAGFALLTLRYVLEIVGPANRFAFADRGQDH